MPQRTCEECGAPFAPERARQSRCPRHELRGRAGASPTNRAQRDGTGDYDRNRRTLLASSPRCHWCPAPATTADHLVPVARGGGHDLANLAPACARCNARRRDTAADAFAAQRPMSDLERVAVPRAAVRRARSLA